MHRQHDELSRRDLAILENEARHDACCGSAGTGDPRLQRRTFIKMAGVGAAALAAAAQNMPAIAGPFTAEDLVDHCVPADKKLSADWVRQLTERGQPTVYQGTDLETIGMPVGGIGAGQLYLTGDGQLAHWDIFNLKTAGYGYPRKPALPHMPVEQGFAVRVRRGAEAAVYPLNGRGFPDVAFRGTYPAAEVRYGHSGCPVAVTLSAFSPFIPLNPDDSSLPATVMRYTVKNLTEEPLEITLAGWLQNAVCHASGGAYTGDLVNAVVSSNGRTMVVSSARRSERPVEERPAIELASFEGGDYGQWTAEGEAFGAAPAKGTLAGQQRVDGFQGQGLVNTFLGGDRPHGKLTSPPFTINRRYISFLIGGGNHAGKTCINLLVDGNIVHTATGRAAERLVWHHWNVGELEGKEAQMEIVDAESGPWGHINIDQIELTDRPRSAFEGPLESQPDFGTLGLTVLGPEEQTLASHSIPSGELPNALFDGAGLAAAGEASVPLGTRLCGAVGRSLQLAPGQTETISFIVTWHFANRSQSGHYYAARYTDAADVAGYVAGQFDRLCGDTLRWVETYYDATLPYWLLDRIHSTVSTLATSTCEIWNNGRFWAYEGVRCCHGTCGHVWNYEHALARLFPQLERTVREMQDFNPEAGLVADTGMIRFRGDWPDFWCGDAQTGYILKAYREHQTCSEGDFLARNWKQIRKALVFLFEQDANDDGVIENQQHNTYDINFFGPNPMIGTLYLGALRAGEEMAREMNDGELADRCRRVFESGRRFCSEKLFNGEYYIQIVDLKEHPKHQHGDGCLSDQLFGQGWAHQVGLGHILPTAEVNQTLASIWKYNWAPDIAPQNEAHPPQRWFAYPGEAGLFTCTWPKSQHLGPESVLYRDEIWTGIEYQVAGNMAWEGMVTEALAICRAVHERYHPIKHNPWNEIECGDHYARGMASWGVLTGLAGFEYHGPRQRIGFAPRLQADAFRCPFTGAAGWGTLDQQRQGNTQTNRIALNWGVLPVATVTLEVPAGRTVRGCRVLVAGTEREANVAQTGTRVTVSMASPVQLQCGETLEVTTTV